MAAPSNKRGSGGFCEIVEVPNTLKQKVGDGPPVLDELTIRRLDNLIASQRPLYLPILDEDLEAMLRVIGGLADGAPLDQADNRSIFLHAHRIRGEAGMHGFQLLEAVANLLCECLDAPEEVAPNRLTSFARLHVDAMQAARAANLTALGGPEATQLIEGLRRAREKLRG